MIEGAVILFFGLLVGFGAGRVTRKPGFKAIRPICGCGHHLSYHDDKGCSWHKVSLDYWGKVVAGSEVTCPCRKYVLNDDSYMAALGP